MEDGIDPNNAMSTKNTQKMSKLHQNSHENIETVTNPENLNNNGGSQERNQASSPKVGTKVINSNRKQGKNTSPSQSLNNNQDNPEKEDQTELQLKNNSIKIGKINKTKAQNHSASFSNNALNQEVEKSSTVDDFQFMSKLGKFQIIQGRNQMLWIGDGAYSSVYKVKRIEDGAQYALKKVKLDHLSEKEKENAINEVRILASIHHPNIISYKEAFIDHKSQSLW